MSDKNEKEDNGGTLETLREFGVSVNSIRLSLTQVIAIILVLVTLVITIEDRYAKNEDVDVVKQSLISYMNQQNKTTQELVDFVKWYNWAAEQEQQRQARGQSDPKALASPVVKNKMPPKSHHPNNTDDVYASSNTERHPPTMGVLELPERLFINSKGEPILPLTQLK